MVITIPDLYGQDPVFSQYYNTPLQINPAFAGNSIGPTFTANYRNQWPAFDAYNTYSVSYNQRFDRFNSGVGLYILSDDAGAGSIKNNKVSGMFSYRLTFDQESSIRFGLEGSFVQSRLDWSKLIFFDQIDPQFGAIGPDGVPFPSNEIPPDADNVSSTYIDISAGVLYYTPRFYAGISFKHLNEPDYSFFNDNRNVDANLPLRTTIIAGYQHNLLDPSRSHYGTFISPSVLYARQGDFSQLNMGALFNFNQLFMGGWYRLSGRTGDAVIASMGWRYEYIKFGYSFDFTISDLGINSGGSHEIGIVVNLDHLYSKGSRYNDCFAIFR
jgi:type IX secretion system PorP/SprF family membrane protein